MKILLVNAPWYGENWKGTKAGCRWNFISEGTPDKRNLSKQKDFYYATFPFFLSFATSKLIQAGYDAVLYDALAICDTYEEFYARIKKEKPDIVLLETSTPSWEQDMVIAQNLNSEGIKVAIAGPMVQYAVETLKIQNKETWVDFWLIGEYIESILEIAKTQRKGIYESIPTDILKLPMPYRDDNVLLYNDYFSFGQFIPKPQLQIWTSFGCPYSCTFCLWRWTMTYGKYRKRPIEDIKKEIRYCLDKWHFKSILFDDDTFNVGDEHPTAIARMMRNEFKNISWAAMVRSDSCKLDTFKFMFDCGCMGLKVGVETFFDCNKNVDKGLKIDNLLERIIQIHNIGFYCYLSTMQYIPGETEIDRKKTEQTLKDLTQFGIRWQRPACTPICGTPLYKKFAEFEKKEYNNNIDFFELGKYYNNEILQKRIKEFSKNG